MQQSLGQNQLSHSPQMVQQSSIAQAQQQMAQSQLAQQQQQQIAQSQLAQQQIAQSQMAQQQLAQSQMAQQQIHQQHLVQQQLAQSQMAQQQLAQSQLAQQQLAQSHLAQQQITQPQIVQQQITQPQIIQQQLAQQQMGQQQLQQMMYCPTVRLVYDTPMQLMQPGDQIQQQNQNIFVNQPPWARPVQNQVIYVQQIGSNLVPVQHLDPNMFLQQNIPMYQQVVQNVPQLVQNIPQTVQNLPQGQLRHVLNNIPAGMVPNFGTNIQRIQDPNLGMVQNFGLVQANTDVTMNNLNVANNEADKQVIANQVNAQPVTATQEVMQVYKQNVAQTNQQQQVRTQQNGSPKVSHHVVTNSLGQPIGTHIRPVVPYKQPKLAMKTSNVKHNQSNTTQVAQNNTTNTNNVVKRSASPNVNTIGTNTTNGINNMQQMRNIQNQNVNVGPQNIPQNTVPMQNFATSVGALNTVTYSAVRNGQPYVYRAIQPKTNNDLQINYKPRGHQMPMLRRALNSNSVCTNTSPIPTNCGSMETDNPNFNRKRKSESPDEIEKKISNYGSITVTAQVKDKIKAKYANTSEIGVNTSPVHKMHKVSQNTVENLLPLLQINPIEAKIQQEFHNSTPIAANTASTINNSANVSISTEAGEEIKDKKDSKDMSQQTEEKLVRKTVFPQAKVTGRLLDAKASLDMPKIDEPTTAININHESVLEPCTNEPKNSTNDNNIATVSQQTQIIHKKNTTVNDNIKPNLKTGVVNISQIASKQSNTNEIPNVSQIASKQSNTNEIPPNTHNVDKPNDVKIELPTKKETGSIVQNILVPASSEIKHNSKPKRVNNEKATKVTDRNQTDTKLNTGKLAEKSETEILTADNSIPIDSDFEKEIKDNKIEKKEYKNISVNEMKGKEIHIVDGNIHEEKRDFLLTHVLDGFVIQESNVPFAIRRPLKEKTVNAYVEDKNDPCIKAAKDEIRGHILELSQLHLNESKEKEKLEKEASSKEKDDDEEDSEGEQNETIATEFKEEETVIENDITKDNPFETLKQAVVKLWTVEDLAIHLAKYSWTETVSTLQEHEIDGESLFLVTKTQLTTIGVNETHAEVICEFVGSKNALN